MDDEMVGVSVSMGCVHAAIDRFAACKTPLVLIGETGTGKSRLARRVAAIQGSSAAPFISIDGLGLMPQGAWPAVPTLESSAACDIHYAWAAACGGTLFIDHIGETSAPLQMHLAHLLRHGDGVSVQAPRVIVANQRRLDDLVGLRLFDADLFARVHGLAIHLPALRSRLQDIPALAEHFLRHTPTTADPYQLADATVTRLQRYAWPGNVRELDNVLRRAMVLAGARRTLQPHDIVFDARGFAAQSRLHQVRLRPTP